MPRKRLTDAEGLSKAYGISEGTYTEGDTLYVAGTKSLRDAWDDLKIPFGLTSKGERYQNASLVLSKMPQVKRIVGHSLGGAIALELAEKKGLQSVTYGAPVMSTKGGERFKQALDPIAIFDWGAKTALATSANPHSYAELASMRRSEDTATPLDGYINLDKSLSLYR
jgi:pimeloyl-ACP methyl ester carboxylesterase